MLNSKIVPADEVTVYNFDRIGGIIGMMDGGGSNLVKINDDLGGVVDLIITSRPNDPDCKAKQRAEEFGVPLVDVDFRQYERERGIFPGDYLKALDPKTYNKIKSKRSVQEIIQVRKDVTALLDEKTLEAMSKHQIPLGMPRFAAGWMALLPGDYVKEHYIVNVHPGQLTQYEVDGLSRGKRTITGDAWRPSAKAISAGHEELYSSMHIMTPEMDEGPNKMRGYPLHVDLNFIESYVDIRDRKIQEQIGGIAQDILKVIGDHVIAGATFLDDFDKKWGMHKSGVLAYRFGDNWHLVPHGITAYDHAENNPDTPFKRDPQFVIDQTNKFHDEVKKLAA